MIIVYSTSTKTYHQEKALDHDIPSLKEYSNLLFLANRIKLRIISKLEHLRPGKNSKISHYSENQVKLSTLVYNALIMNSLHIIKNTFTHTDYA